MVKVSHNGFDTHSGQQGVHARLLKELAEGLTAMRAAMREIGRWDSTLNGKFTPVDVLKA